VGDIDISVVIPTRNERNNIHSLIRELSSTLADQAAEVVFVDDSTDDTPDVVAEIAKTSSLPIHVIHRGPGQRVGGLSGAVVVGLHQARGRIAVVMDGDLQHPPRVIPQLVQPIEDGEADLVVGSRYQEDGGLGGLSNRARIGCSLAATRLTKLMFRRRLSQVTDPMSGFFAVRTAALDLGSLRPVGFKILLETIVRSDLVIKEVGFRFEPRMSGVSKASFREGMRFCGHLVRLRAGTVMTPRQRRAAGFATVGASGLVVNTVAFWLFLHFTHVPYLLAAALATQVSTTWNFAGMEMFVFAGRKSGGFWQRYLKFCVLNNTVMLARLPVLAFLVSVVHCPKTLANVATLLLVFVVRFGVSDRYIYDREPGESLGEQAAVALIGPVEIAIETDARMPSLARGHAVEGFRHWYDIHGILTIGSDVALPELAYFLRPGPASSQGTPDIGVRVGYLGRPRARTRMVQSPDGLIVRWEEHLGPFASNFAVEFGPNISVVSSRSLARSPHVLYTNVIEAMLRFVFVERGYMLLHAACMDVDGQGVLLSARTDTGKTGTVLKMLRSGRTVFLSDDMTILDSSGVARSFPKPLTISHHTLQSVNAGDLGRWEWTWLKVQSRLHSKEGRGFALKLATHNVPIMTINSWTQRAVPPPKYSVQRLVPCEIASHARIAQLYIIERGFPHESAVPQSEAIAEMLVNTEDAYGFPPYRYLSQALSVDGISYDELKERERLILVSAMESVQVHRLGSDNFTWADRITAKLVDSAQDTAHLSEIVAPTNGSSANGSAAHGAASNGLKTHEAPTVNGAALNGTTGDQAIDGELLDVPERHSLPESDAPPTPGAMGASSAPQ
jgi:dolichol-phosphate mannosyltransferase